MNQSEINTDEESSSGNSPPQSPKGIDLSAIPHFTPSTTERQTQNLSMAPPSCNERPSHFEYEFSTIFDGRISFITLWDDDDLSAAQRACCCNLDKNQITYNEETGNGFFKVRDEDWCFRKEPYQRSWGPHNQVETFKPEPSKKLSPTTADEILATLQ